MLSETHLWSRRSPLNFGSHMDPKSESGLRIWTRIRTGFVLAEVCTLVTLLIYNLSSHTRKQRTRKEYKPPARLSIDRELTYQREYTVDRLPQSRGYIGRRSAVCGGRRDTARWHHTDPPRRCNLAVSLDYTHSHSLYTRQSVFIAATQALFAH